MVETVVVDTASVLNVYDGIEIELTTSVLPVIVDANIVFRLNEVSVIVEIEVNTPDIVEKEMNGAIKVDKLAELPIAVDTLVFAFSVDTFIVENWVRPTFPVIDVILEAVRITEESVETDKAEVTAFSALAVLPYMVENKVEVVMDSVFPKRVVATFVLVYNEEMDKLVVLNVVPITVE